MSPLESPLDILVVAPHPDDAELSVGGTIVTSRRQGLRVGVLELTNGEPTPHGSIERRARETAASTRILDLTWRHMLGLPNRMLRDDVEARRAVAAVFRQTRPKIILAPYWEDTHPDHVAASQLIDAARFWSKLTRTDIPGEPYHPPRIYYYWSIHLRIHPKPAFVIDIGDAIEPKLAAIRCYESQNLELSRDGLPSIVDDIRDRARYWGWTIGRHYAEPFASREEIGLKNFPDHLPS
jgi:bacillithiol biosynthesis deacetylase BshB1